jgi:hypothetical protein
MHKETKEICSDLRANARTSPSSGPSLIFVPICSCFSLAFFFSFCVDKNSALVPLGIYSQHTKEKEFVVFFYFSPRARDTRAERVRCATIKSGPRDEMR